MEKCGSHSSVPFGTGFLTWQPVTVRMRLVGNSVLFRGRLALSHSVVNHYYAHKFGVEQDCKEQFLVKVEL
jgi:hypothetical protein